MYIYMCVRHNNSDSALLFQKHAVPNRVNVVLMAICRWQNRVAILCSVLHDQQLWIIC